jgi:hypothetical protein
MGFLQSIAKTKEYLVPALKVVIKPKEKILRKGPETFDFFACAGTTGTLEIVDSTS